jgi:hypothetical protein
MSGRALVTDAKETFVCSYLSLTLLAAPFLPRAQAKIAQAIGDALLAHVPVRNW